MMNAIKNLFSLKIFNNAQTENRPADGAFIDKDGDNGTYIVRVVHNGRPLYIERWTS